MYIVADIGGTHVRLALTDLESLNHVIKFDTPQLYEDFVARFIEQVRILAGSEHIEAICLGIPGVLSHDREAIYRTPNLPGWSGKALVWDLQNALGDTRILLQNDTALLGLGEALQPEMQGYEVVGFLGFGTGVGGVRIDQGKIEHAALGFEPGHQIIDFTTMREWEGLIGGSDIEEETGQKIPDIQDQQFWDMKHHMLAVGIYNTILMWSPAALVFGGGMIINGTYQLELIQQKLNNINKLLPSLPPLFKTKLGDEAGLYGGMYYLRQSLNA